MRALEEKLLCLKSGSTILTLSNPLTTPAYTLEEKLPLPFGWGTATVFIYRRN